MKRYRPSDSGDSTKQDRASVRTAGCLLAFGLAGFAPVAALAQAASDPWQWDVAVYGWLPALGGSTSFRVPGGGPSFDVDANKLVGALKFAFMGTLEGRKGQWGVLTDLVYADIGGSKNGTRDFTLGSAQPPVDVSANLSLDVKSWIWTVAGTYNLATKPEGSADLVFGARLLDLKQTLGWSLNGSLAGQPLLPRSGSATLNASNWDAIVGVKGRFNIGSDGKWFVPYYVDVGTGQSQLTWQAIVGLGYQFNWGAVGATWRYLDYNFKSGSRISSMNFSGPAIGMTYHF